MMLLEPSTLAAAARLIAETLEKNYGVDYHPLFKRLELDIRGHKLVYDVESSTLTFLKSKLNLPVAEKLTLRIVVDNLSTDIFAGKDGLFHIPNMIPGGQKSKALSVAAIDGVVIFEKLHVHDLKSIW